MISAHIRYVCTERERTAVFIRESKRLTPQLRKEYLGDEHAYRNFFQKVIAEGRQAGLIHQAVDPKLAALCLLGSLNSLYDGYRPSGGFPIKAIAEHFAITALSGMTTERGESAAKTVRTQNKKRAPATAV